MVRRKMGTVRAATTLKPKKRKASGTPRKLPSVQSGDFEWSLQKLNEHVSTRAYFIWQEMGMPSNDDMKIWRQAEKDILSRLIKK